MNRAKGARSLCGVLLLILVIAFPGEPSADTFTILNPQPASLAVCGAQNSPPFALASDAGHRACGPRKARGYTPRNRGIGFKILDLESEACFVPDEAYRLLDDVIDDVRARLKSTPIQNSVLLKVQAIGRITSEVLKEKGFALSLPTDTLGDALVARGAANEKPRHIFDCDTGSMIYLTVADALATPASLVEITLPSGDQHNYVRWQIDRKTKIDWDPNGQAQCVTPATARSYQGRSFTYDQTISYVLTLRADLWIEQKAFARAIDDYREAIRLFPERPGAYAGLAWLLATTNFSERNRYKRMAVQTAKRAVSLRRSADNLDTLACAYAFAGDFDRAAETEREALSEAPKNADYLHRIERFKSGKFMDCTLPH